MEESAILGETSKSYPNENTNGNTSSKDSKNGEKSQKHKNLKKAIQRIIQPGNSIQIKISNMKLVNIPFQQTRVYVKTKVGHSKSGLKSTTRVNINDDNTANWDDEISLHYKLPFNSKDQQFLRRSLSNDSLLNSIQKEKHIIENHFVESNHNSKKNNKHKGDHNQNGKIKIHPYLNHEKNRTHDKKHSLKPFYVRFSFRLEDNSGNGHTRFGVTYFNLKKLHSLKNVEFKSPLKYCNYEAIFTCNISIKSNRRSSCDFTSSQILPQYFEQSFSNSNSCKPRLDNHLKSNEKNDSDNLSESDCANKNTEWKLLESLADLYSEQNELPFKIKTQKISDLSQQVDNILKITMHN